MTEAEKIAEIRKDASMGEAAWDDVQLLLEIIDRLTRENERLTALLRSAPAVRDIIIELRDENERLKLAIANDCRS